MLYAKSTGGFYNADIHVIIPADAVEITDMEYADLLSGQSAGQVISTDSTGKPILVTPASLMSLAQVQADQIATLTSAVQTHLDAAAKMRGYDNIVSACSYAGAANAFQAEGIAYLDWRAAVWQHCYQALSDVQAGTRSAPTTAELIAELPALVLP